MYAVFDVKHQLRREAILEAGTKAESVRKLKRTTVPVKYVGGTYKPGPLFEVIAGVLCLEAWWSSGRLVAALDKVLSELPPPRFIDPGCAARSGSFEATSKGKKVRVERSSRETALIFFFLRLLHGLQQVGKVRAMDIMKCGSSG